MNKSDLNLDEVFKRLHLANARRNWRALCDQAERESWSYRDLLAMLTAEEVSQRQQTRLQRLARKARFPFLKTIDEFNFTFQSTVKLPLIGSYLSPDFVSDGRCLVLTGKPGRGKTHLAIAIAYRAIQNGFDVLFTTAAALIDDLSAAGTKSQFREALRTHTAPDVLVIDKVGYLTYGPDAANVLFHVVNERHQKRRPMIFTTNKDLTAWGKVLHDVDLAEAIVDRILERGRLLKLDGPSIRTKDLGLDSTQDQQLTNTPVRISGINPAEYLEPTPGIPRSVHQECVLVFQYGGCAFHRGSQEFSIDGRISVGRARATRLGGRDIRFCGRQDPYHQKSASSRRRPENRHW